MIEYWTISVIGLMMIVSPWVLGFSDISLAKWCNVLLGLVLAIAGAWRVFGTVSVDTLPITEEPQKKKRKTKNNVEQK